MHSAQIRLFMSLFKGREDVYAIRRVKGGKGSYMPAYDLDPYMYQLHKKAGGTFANYRDKSLKPLTEATISDHLAGKYHVGIYPLLKDNTSWFIAADFDGSQWLESAGNFMRVCREFGIASYLERSRSGNGGHVWIFFREPVHAQKSRNVVFTLLQKAGVVSKFDKNAAFDRLFPNQNYLSGKGFGNLIALPLFKLALAKGNCCFIASDTAKPYEDQWKFLENITRISESQMDEIAASLIPEQDTPLFDVSKASGSYNSSVKDKRITIILRNNIEISSTNLPEKLVSYLREELNFPNQEYYVKKNTGINTYKTERFFKLVEETDKGASIPRGMTGNLIRFCRENDIPYNFRDDRNKMQGIIFKFLPDLHSHQQKALQAACKKDFGIIVAPPGSGKTITALKIVAEKQQPALIVVHRRALLEQWTERIKTFMAIPAKEIGKIGGGGKNRIRENLTVATVQSLGKLLEKPENDFLKDSFGIMIVDECHHIPAKSWRNTLSLFNTYYQYGLTATPFRKFNDEKLIFAFLGEIISELSPGEIEKTKHPRVIVRQTDLQLPFNPKTDKFETLSRVLIHDSTRNRLILEDINAELNKGKKAVILTERKEHIDALYQFLKQSYETITLSGDDQADQRKSKWKALKLGNYQALITTGQLFGEGTDLDNANVLFLVYPFSFKGKLIQYIGRIQRSEIAPVIYDYADQQIEYLRKLFLKRNKYYRELEKFHLLADDNQNATEFADGVTIEKQIKILWKEISFRYGDISFRYHDKKTDILLDFEIENEIMRPEFEVLKPYFAKQLKSSGITVDIFAEIENGRIVSQSAVSKDIEKLNNDLVESVRIQFVTKQIFSKKPANGDQNIAGLENMQQQDKDYSLYDSEEELLKDVLKNASFLHHHYLRYLAGRHEKSVLKVRFVLKPFSFVFLLRGKTQYHIVLETLDTQEATYVWHIDTTQTTLGSALESIENDLTFIRNKGRHAFLKNPPRNFSRIFHEYTDSKKGFIIWKDALEERLV